MNNCIYDYTFYGIRGFKNQYLKIVALPIIYCIFGQKICINVCFKTTDCRFKGIDYIRCQEYFCF